MDIGLYLNTTSPVLANRARLHAKHGILQKSIKYPQCKAFTGGGGGNGRKKGDGGGKGDDDDDDGNRRHPRLHWICASVAAHALSLSSRSALANQSKEVDEAVDETWDWLGPVIGSLGFSGLLGFCSAMAFQFFGRAIAIVFGLFFLMIQGLVFVGVVDIHWDVVEKKLDLTGDEKFDEADVKVIYRNLLRVIAQGVPGVTGFTAGFLLGLRLG